MSLGESADSSFVVFRSYFIGHTQHTGDAQFLRQFHDPPPGFERLVVGLRDYQQSVGMARRAATEILQAAKSGGSGSQPIRTKSLKVYLNLARRMRLTGIDQLWVADITYLRLKAEFVYLAVILDGFSRRVVGWALERTLASRLAVAALEQAIAQRRPRPASSTASATNWDISANGWRSARL